ncbi:DUF3575 domain-containing protein [Flavobacteriaceae bacterium]|nr:DUF3575 domain-containing protein [Flavobacteriaceae bacterium]
MFKKSIFLALVMISGLMTAQTDSLFHSKAEIKFNLASALLLIPNIGIEVQLSEKFGYQLDTSASFIDNLEGSPFHSTQIFNELRYYPKLKEGKNPRSFFIGPHIGYGMFTLRIPKFITSLVDTELKEEGSYQSGRNAYYGVTIGKKIPLKSKKLNLEIFIGGGTSQSSYKYYNKFGNRIYENPDIEKDFNQSGEELIYKGGLMLTYKL